MSSHTSGGWLFWSQWHASRGVRQDFTFTPEEMANIRRILSNIATPTPNGPTPRKAPPMPTITKAARAAKAATNPAEVSLSALMAAYKQEKDNRGWCDSPNAYFESLTDDNGVRLFAQYPQYNAETKAYDKWAPNPERTTAAPDTISASKVFGLYDRVKRDYNDRSYVAAMDRILAAVGLTYVAYEDTMEVTAKCTVTAEQMKAAGYPADLASLRDADRRDYANELLRSRMRGYGEYNLEITVIPDPARPASTNAAVADTKAA